jgi:hypothetical protein
MRGRRTLNNDGTVTVRVSFAATEGLVHTRANDQSLTTPGLYIGARGTPKTEVTSLGDAFTWIAANAEENGRYRYVLGANASQAAKVLDGAAFGNKAGVVITLAGGTEERTVLLTGTGQLFKVSGGTLRLGGNVTLKGVAANSGGILAAVESGGTLIMETDSKITGNTSSAGGNYASGGVLARESGVFTMNGGEISGNTALIPTGNYSGSDANGGGVWIGDAVFVMSGGSISGNTAQNGGGVYGNGGSGTFTMSGGAVISGNKAVSAGTGTAGATPPAYSGGGVYVRGTFTMQDTAVTRGMRLAARAAGCISPIATRLPRPAARSMAARRLIRTQLLAAARRCIST